MGARERASCHCFVCSERLALGSEAGENQVVALFFIAPAYRETRGRCGSDGGTTSLVVEPLGCSSTLQLQLTGKRGSSLPCSEPSRWDGGSVNITSFKLLGARHLTRTLQNVPRKLTSN